MRRNRSEVLSKVEVFLDQLSSIFLVIEGWSRDLFGYRGLVEGLALLSRELGYRGLVKRWFFDPPSTAQIKSKFSHSFFRGEGWLTRALVLCVYVNQLSKIVFGCKLVFNISVQEGTKNISNCYQLEEL